MSLFSKLLGNNQSGESPLDAIKKAAQEVMNETAAKLNEAAENINAAQSDKTDYKPYSPVSAPVRQSAASGDSWGPEMPAEENQYNFNGTYIQYFDQIFRADFPGYQIVLTEGLNPKSPVFMFYDGARQALAVELKSQNSSAQRIRRSCEAAGIPYLRFYFDHDGWWNTRSYVTARVRRALNG